MRKILRFCLLAFLFCLYFVSGVVFLCDAMHAQQQFELKCPTSPTPTQVINPPGTTFDAPTNRYRQWLCVDANGNVTIQSVNLLNTTGGSGSGPLTNPLLFPTPSGALSTPPAGQTGFGSQFASNCCAQGVPSMWAPALNSATYSWQPITYLAVNTLAPANVNGQNLNSTVPAAPANGINVTWQRSAPTGASLQRQDISAAIVGNGDPLSCLIGTGTFTPCPNGVGAGVAGQFPVYNGANSIVGNPNLVDGLTTAGFITSIEPLNVTTTGKTLSVYGQVPTSVTAPYTFISSGATGNSAGTVPFFSGSNSGTTAGNGGISVPLPTIQINGTNPSLSIQNFNSTTPVAPTNGINVTWTRVSTGITAAVVGNGNVANCLSGVGTYVPCGSTTGSGTVGNGTANQFAFYATTGTTVTGTPDLTDVGGRITVTTTPGLLVVNDIATSGHVILNAGCCVQSTFATAIPPTPATGVSAIGYTTNGTLLATINGAPNQNIVPFVSTCAATGGNCSQTFPSGYFVNAPACVATPIDATPTDSITWKFSSISSSIYSLTYLPTTLSITFNVICYGNPV